MKLLVENLSRLVTQAELQEAFAPYGGLLSVALITDPQTQRSVGSALVDFASEEDAAKAAAATNGTTFHVRRLHVRPAPENAAELEIARAVRHTRGGQRPDKSAKSLMAANSEPVSTVGDAADPDRRLREGLLADLRRVNELLLKARKAERAFRAQLNALGRLRLRKEVADLVRPIKKWMMRFQRLQPRLSKASKEELKEARARLREIKQNLREANSHWCALAKAFEQESRQEEQEFVQAQLRERLERRRHERQELLAKAKRSAPHESDDVGNGLIGAAALAGLFFKTMFAKPMKPEPKK